MGKRALVKAVRSTAAGGGGGLRKAVRPFLRPDLIGAAVGGTGGAYTGFTEGYSRGGLRRGMEDALGMGALGAVGGGAIGMGIRGIGGTGRALGMLRPATTPHAQVIRPGLRALVKSNPRVLGSAGAGAVIGGATGLYQGLNDPEGGIGRGIARGIYGAGVGAGAGAAAYGGVKGLHWLGRKGKAIAARETAEAISGLKS